jgi:hypothetical protein
MTTLDSSSLLFVLLEISVQREEHVVAFISGQAPVPQQGRTDVQQTSRL